jgi:branched-chain amino acid transport system substrate-binding protein
MGLPILSTSMNPVSGWSVLIWQMHNKKQLRPQTMGQPGGISQRGGRSLMALAVVAPLLASCGPRPGGTGSGGSTGATAPLTIGAAIALTGNASVIGQDQRIGLELAHAHYNGKGPELALKIEDGGSDEVTATNAFRSLINNQVVALIGPSLSQQAFAVDPIADRAGIPVVGPSNTAKGIPQIGPFVARVSAPVAQVAPLSIAAALKLNPKIRRAAVFYAQDDAYSTSESKIFQQVLNERNLKPLSVQKTSVSDTDFQNQITDTLRRNPDLIVISALPSDGGNLVRQLRELGFKGTLVAGNGMNSPNIYPICQRSCDGMLIAQAYSPEAVTPINRTFLSLYSKARGGAIPPQFTAQAFTAYQVVAEALASLKRSLPAGSSLASLPRQELRRQLNATLLKGTYQTPLGEIRFTPEGEVIQKRFYVAQVRMEPDGTSGRFQLVP